MLFAYDKKNYQSVKDNKIFARDPITLESIVISKNKFIGLPNRSRHNINANIGYMDKYFLRFLVRSKYGVYDTNGNGFIDHYDSSIINNYLNINFSYNAELTKNLSLNLTIKNLNNFKMNLSFQMFWKRVYSKIDLFNQLEFKYFLGVVPNLFLKAFIK